jgi:uncharacterized protein (TIGR03435 family)
MKHLIVGFAFLACSGSAQTPLSFEVASVKPSPPVAAGARVFFGPARGGPGTSDPGQITWTNATLKNLFMTAFEVRAYQVNGPAWLDTERYDIVAKVPAGTTKEQVNVMWQNLLTERFGVKLHHESKEFQVQELVVGKDGPKMKESAENPNEPAPPVGPPTFDKNGGLSSPGFVIMMMMGTSGPIARATSKTQPISRLTAMLTTQVGRPVLDKTGLAGKYDFTLEFTPDLHVLQLPPPPPGLEGAGPPPAPLIERAGDPGPDLAAAIQKQLGLRLVANKAKLDVVVIDKVEKVPTEN